MDTTRKSILAGTSALALACAATGAFAQKAKDTIRIGAAQPIAVIDAVYDPQPQTNLMDRMVFDTLVNYDSDKREIVPGSRRVVDAGRSVDARVQAAQGHQVPRRFGPGRRRCRLHRAVRHRSVLALPLQGDALRQHRESREGRPVHGPPQAEGAERAVPQPHHHVAADLSGEDTRQACRQGRLRAQPGRQWSLQGDPGRTRPRA